MEAAPSNLRSRRRERKAAGSTPSIPKRLVCSTDSSFEDVEPKKVHRTKQPGRRWNSPHPRSKFASGILGVEDAEPNRPCVESERTCRRSTINREEDKRGGDACREWGVATATQRKTRDDSSLLEKVSDTERTGSSCFFTLSPWVSPPSSPASALSAEELSFAYVGSLSNGTDKSWASTERAEGPEEDILCSNCRAPGCSLVCACNEARYCGTDCQSADVARHAEQCAASLCRRVDAAMGETSLSAYSHWKPDDDTAAILAAAETRIEAGVAHMNGGRHDQAETCLLEARCILGGLGEVEGGRKHPRLAHACLQLWKLYEMAGLRDKSVQMLQESLCARGGVEQCADVEVAKGFMDLGHLCLDLGRLSESMDAYETGLKIYRGLHGEMNPDVACALSNIAMVLTEREQHCTAAKMFRIALKIRRNVHGHRHEKVGETLRNLGTVLHKLGEYEDALEVLDEAIFIEIRVNGTFHENVASLLYAAALSKQQLGEADGALESTKWCVAIYKRLMMTSGPSPELSAANSLLKQLTNEQGRSGSRCGPFSWTVVPAKISAKLSLFYSNFVRGRDLESTS